MTGAALRISTLTAMNTLRAFSEKERAYHAYQARQNYLRVQHGNQRRMDELQSDVEQECAAKKQALAAKEHERMAKDRPRLFRPKSRLFLDTLMTKAENRPLQR